MNKLIASYMIMYLLFAYFSSVAEGGGGLVSTTLESNVSISEESSIHVTSTSGFLTAGTIVIASEDIRYSSINGTHFLTLERGQKSSDAVAHSSGALVYAPELGVLNRALGFEVVGSGEDIGTFNAIKTGLGFFVQSLGHLISFNFSILGGQMVYLRYLFMAPAVGLVIYLAFMAMGTAFGIIRR